MSRLYIALVDLDEEFSVETHSRNDLTAFSLSIKQSEGELATASIEIQNPRTPLSALENRRVMISERNTLIFDGLIQTVPRGAIDATLTIEAVATSAQLSDQLKALAQSLKVAPFYDPLFVPAGSENDLADILAGYPRVIAHSRIKGTPSAVDALSGATTVEIKPLDGSLSFDMEGKIPPAFGIDLEVSWRQLIKQQFFINSELSDLTTMTPEKVIADWPKQNATIGTDFRVSNSTAQRASGFRNATDTEIITREDVVSDSEMDPAFIDEGKETLTAEIVPVDLKMTVEYQAEVRRRETCKFSLPINMQPAAVSDDEPEFETVRLRDIAEYADLPRFTSGASYVVGDQIIDGSEVFSCIRAHRAGSRRISAFWRSIGTSPYILSRRVASFFDSTRGRAALSHAAERVNARALIAARNVRVSFEAAMPRTDRITHDCVVRLLGAKIPGGSVEGRLIDYTLSWTNGRRTMTGTIACCAGAGGETTAQVSHGENNPPSASGRVDVEYTGGGADQAAAFNGRTDIPETEIKIATVPVPQTDYEHEFAVIVSGSIAAPKQVIA